MTARPTLIASIALFSLVFIPSLSQGQVYSWKDANGKIHYGDRPPAERQPDARKLAPAPASDDIAAARKAAAERQFNEREQQAKAGDNAKKPPEDPAQARVRAENCQRARHNLAAMESGQIRFSTNQKGERIALDGSVREAELAKARKSVDDWCKPPAPAK